MVESHLRQRWRSANKLRKSANLLDLRILAYAICGPYLFVICGLKLTQVRKYIGTFLFTSIAYTGNALIQVCT
jgi:hypothetical protein